METNKMTDIKKYIGITVGLVVGGISSLVLFPIFGGVGIVQGAIMGALFGLVAEFHFR